MDGIQIQIPRGMAEYARAFLGQRHPRPSRGAVRRALEARSSRRPDTMATWTARRSAGHRRRRCTAWSCSALHPSRDRFDPIGCLVENDLERRRQCVRWRFRRDGRECELRAFRKLHARALWRAELRALDGGHVEPLEDTALTPVAPAGTFATPRHAFDELVGRLPAGQAPATARRPDSRLV
jgi:hypothetical protein